jgi:hypothetical protein
MCIDIGLPPLILCCSFTNKVVSNGLGILLKGRLRNGSVKENRLVVSSDIRVSRKGYPSFRACTISIDLSHIWYTAS